MVDPAASSYLRLLCHRRFEDSLEGFGDRHKAIREAPLSVCYLFLILERFKIRSGLRDQLEKGSKHAKTRGC